MKPSKRQQAVYDTWENENVNIIIRAVAGSGKTTTLLQLLERSNYKTLFVAFNKSIQEEIQEKIESRGLRQGKALTMHSLGLMAIRNYYGSKTKININDRKNGDLIIKLQKSKKWKKTFRNLGKEDSIKMFFLLSDMNDVSRMFLTDDVKVIFDHFKSMDKPTIEMDQITDMWSDFIKLREESYQGQAIDIDFNDMIYLPVYKDMRIPIDPVYLMIDEAQDLNLSQHKLIDNLINQGDIKKWIAVGDRNQSIYGFAGAYSSSFDLFHSKEGKTVELPLDICYRCAPEIIESANEVYPVMQPFRDKGGKVGIATSISEIKDSSMVVCRNTGPLIKLYFQLLADKRNCYIKGNDIISSLKRFLAPYKSDTIQRARLKMESKFIRMRDDTDEERRSKYIFKENMSNFDEISYHLCSDHETVDLLINRLKSIFISKDNAIVLCTIHKAKGLESDVVYILDEDLIPSKFAKSREQLKQEQNLKYVARTRAKNEMYFLKIKT